jgi:hypothetical protein
MEIASFISAVIALLLFLWVLSAIADIRAHLEAILKTLKEAVEALHNIEVLNRMVGKELRGKKEAAEEGLSSFACPNCKQKNSVSRALAGKMALCEHCNEPCKVPE